MNNKTIAIITAAILSVRLQAQPFDPASNVNPFIGTGGAGHTYPGATLPYGMVQLSPDTRIDGSWEGCSGYHYSDSVMHGFTHTHLSGTGCSDYGDILLLPYSSDSLPVRGRGVRFNHSDEKASPGSYSVLLKEEGIRVSLTATARTGFHRYEYASTGNRNVLIDLLHRDKLTDGRIRIVSDRRIEGFRRSSAWASDQLVYFCIEFDRPFLVTGHEKAKLPLVFNKDACRIGLHFPGGGEAVQAKVALSSVSEKNAWLNLTAESAGWDYQDVSGKARNEWNKELRRIEKRGYARTVHRVLYRTVPLHGSPEHIQRYQRRISRPRWQGPQSRGVHTLYRLFALGYLPGLAPADDTHRP
jgi:predicted alpha-1,2-mannosidase